jgi:hypothetical protein
MIQPIAIEKYSDALKDRIVFDHFNKDLFITGESIKNLTPASQINAFVLRNIFDKWQKEAEKLKSPYFDFENDDVRKALNDFMGKLSFHIKINKDYFELILKEAIRDAFEYLENPIYFLQNDVFDFKGNALSYQEIKARSKFLKLYPAKIEEFLNNSQIKQDEVKVNVIMKVIEDVFENVNSLEEEKLFVDQISKVVPNNFINLVETKPAVEKPNSGKRNFIDDLEFDDIEIPEVKDEQADEAPLTETVIEEVEKQELAAEPKASTEAPKITGNTTGKLAPIGSFSEGISMQQRFYFIKELFDADDNMYEYAVKEANNKATFDIACNYLWDNFADKYNWANREEPVAEFLAILNRRY